MKKWLLALALILFPSFASAQCSGVFSPNTVCGVGTVESSRAPHQISGHAINPGNVYDTRVAAVAARIPAGSTAISILGYSSPYDGGGAGYVPLTCPAVNLPDFQSADGQCWQLSTVSPNLLMFGADPNGVADSTTAISALWRYSYANEICGLDTGGIYKFSSVTLTASGGKPFCFIGAGPSATIFRQSGTLNDGFVFDTTTSGINGLVLRSFQMDATSTVTGGAYAIRQIGANTASTQIASNSLISDITLGNNIDGGFQWVGVSELTMQNIEVVNIGANARGISLVGAGVLNPISSITLNNIIFKGGVSGGAGGFTTCVFMGDLVFGVSGDKIFCQGGASRIDYGFWVATSTSVITNGNYIHFTNSYADFTAHNPLLIQGSTDVSFTNGAFFNSGAGYAGVEITGGNTVTVSGARIQGNLREGIRVTGGSAVHIEGNTVCNNGTEGAGTNNYDGIKVGANVSDFTIIGNIDHCELTDTSRYSISVAAGTSDNFVITGNDASHGLTGGVLFSSVSGTNFTAAWNTGTSSPSGNYFSKNILLFGSSALTLPTATDTLVGKATTDTLTNKSIAYTQLTGLGTGVSTALGINVGTAGSPVVNGGALGTPSSGTLTNATGLPTTGLAGTLQAAQEPAHTGDVTNSAGSLALTIANNAVTNAKAAQGAANTMKGNWTGSTANVADNAMPSCSDTTGNHLNYVSGTGVTCGTSGLRTKIITITRDLTVATGSVAYTGCGFQPTNLRAAGAVTGSITQYVVTYAEADSSRTAFNNFLGGTTLQVNTTTFLLFMDSTSANNQAATISSYDSDGFTLSWIKTAAPTGTATISVVCSR